MLARIKRAETVCARIQGLALGRPPAWFGSAAAMEHESPGITFRLRDLSRPGPGLRSVLTSAGLVLDCYLTDDCQWLRAVQAVLP